MTRPIIASKAHALLPLIDIVTHHTSLSRQCLDLSLL